jgi:hypothetical protein
VVHRDLKPSNILMEDGAPHVADFGASSLRGSEAITHSGTSLGTPAYMAPEQTRGTNVGPAADIWALGAILYECLTGYRPFEGKTVEGLMEEVRTAAPPPPRSRVSSVPVELEAITLRCMARLPSGRFASAAEMADDLERWLAGEPVLAKPPRDRSALFFSWFSLGALAAVLSGVLLFPLSRPAPPSAETELASGRPWTFVGPMGMPTNYRWRIDDARRPLPVQVDVPLMFTTWSLTQMEFMPSVPLKSYRFRAELALVGGGRGASAGMFVMGEEGKAGNVPTYSGYQLVLVRQDRKGEHLLLGNFFTMPPAPRQGGVEMNVGNAPVIHNEYLAASVVGLAANPLGRLTTPLLGPQPEGAWHRLELQVTPKRTIAYFDGLPVGEWDRPASEARLKGWWHASRLITKGLPLAPPSFPVKGSLGLIVDQATVRVRNVSVSPLD